MAKFFYDYDDSKFMIYKGSYLTSTNAGSDSGGVWYYKAGSVDHRKLNFTSKTFLFKDRMMILKKVEYVGKIE